MRYRFTTYHYLRYNYITIRNYFDMMSIMTGLVYYMIGTISYKDFDRLTGIPCNCFHMITYYLTST